MRPRKAVQDYSVASTSKKDGPGTRYIAKTRYKLVREPANVRGIKYILIILEQK
jgi:hypothetical protein